MIRIFSNKTNKPNIEIESKLVRERKKVAVSILNSEYFDRIKDGDILFVKIRLNGLEKNQIVNQLQNLKVNLRKKKIIIAKRLIKLQCYAICVALIFLNFIVILYVDWRNDYATCIYEEKWRYHIL